MRIDFDKLFTNMLLRGIFVLGISIPVRAQLPKAELLGGVHAKGLAVVRIVIPSSAESVELIPWISKDGATFIEARSQPPFGMPYRVQKEQADYDSRISSLVAPLVFTVEDSLLGFLFPEPGNYAMKWEISSRAKDEVQPVTQSIQVQAPLRDDLTFLERASHPDLLKKVFGKDQLELADPDFRKWAQSAEGADYRALIVIAELLSAAEAKEPGDLAGPRGRDIDAALQAADAMWTLATDIPDSSYSAYAAHFAGCSYLLGLAQDNKKQKGEITASSGVKSAYFAKASDAFEFSCERADAYLYPRVLFMKGFLHLWTRQLDDATHVLDVAFANAKDQSILRKAIQTIRDEVSVLRTRGGE